MLSLLHLGRTNTGMVPSMCFRDVKGRFIQLTRFYTRF